MTPVQLSWAVAAGILLVMEAVIPGTLVCIWFMLGAVAALLTSLVCPLLWVQIAVFVVVSVVSLVLTRPLINKKIKTKFQPTNADMVVGKTAQVIAAITPCEKGRVRVDGLDWAATADTCLAVGDSCTVQSIAGATLFVTAACGPCPQTQEKEEVTV